MKKTLSILLSFVMLLSVTTGINFSAFADTPVTEVYVTGVKTPYSGDSPVFDLDTNSSAYSIDTTAYNNGVSWYDATESVGLTSNSVFKTGHHYTVTIRIKLNDGYYIDDSQVSCMVDGTPAALSQLPGETKLYDVTLRLSNCLESQVIERVSISDFVFPSAGNKMNTTFTVNGGDAYSLYTVQDDPNFVEGKVEWYDDYTDTYLTANDTFTATHNYWFYIRLAAADGYEFKTKDTQNATNQPSHDVNVSVNGTSYNAQTMAFYHVSWAPSRKYLQIYGTYLCKGSVKTINIKGTENYVAGGRPSYYFYPADSSCVVDPSFNDGREIRDGVGYYDTTDERYMLPGDTFEFGHTYYKEMAVSANFGYTLNGNTGATYNGESATRSANFTHRDIMSDVMIISVNLGKCRKDINSCSVTGISDQYIYTYSGSAKKAVQAIYDGDKKLVAGTDYTVTYRNNINAGTASYTITGIGDYAGIWTGTFRITRKAMTTAAKITQSARNYTYDGSVHKPTIKVYDGSKLLKNNTDYTLTYSNANSRAVNNYTVKVTFKGNYSGTKSTTYGILPKGTTLLKTASTGSTWISPQWNKQTKGTTGYEIMYSTNAGFRSGNKTVTVTNNKTTVKKITGLKRNKKYYFRIRTYKTVKDSNGRTKKVYSANWSPVKEFKTKK